MQGGHADIPELLEHFVEFEVGLPSHAAKNQISATDTRKGSGPLSIATLRFAVKGLF
jgi:hypothetical protein